MDSTGAVERTIHFSEANTKPVEQHVPDQGSTFLLLTLGLLGLVTYRQQLLRGQP